MYVINMEFLLYFQRTAQWGNYVLLFREKIDVNGEKRYWQIEMIHHNVPSNYFSFTKLKKEQMISYKNKQGCWCWIFDFSFLYRVVCYEHFKTMIKIDQDFILKVSKISHNPLFLYLKKSMPSHHVLHHWLALPINAKVWSKYMFLCCQSYCQAMAYLKSLVSKWAPSPTMLLIFYVRFCVKPGTRLNPSHLPRMFCHIE